MNLNRNFLFLMLGQSLANLGDVLYIVGVISVIYSLTESATASAFVPFTITFSMFISSILTPLLVGKFNLKILLLGSQMGKTFILTGLGIFMINGVDLTNYIIIFVGIAGIALLDGCANPIRQTLIPYYVREDKLIKANGIAETITQSIQIGTWFLGSLLLIVINATQLIWLVSLLFGLASLILSFLKSVEHNSENQLKKWDQLTQGWKTIKISSTLKILVKIEFLETIASTVWIAAILYVYVEQALNEQEQWWGFINSSFFVGLFLGSIVCVKFSKFMERNRYVYILTGACMSCVLTILFSMASIPAIALILSAFIGLFGQLKNIPQQTLIQTSVPQEKLATVYTSIGTISTGTFGVSSLLIGLLSDYFGVRSVFVFSGFLLVIVSFMVFKNKNGFRERVKQE